MNNITFSAITAAAFVLTLVFVRAYRDDHDPAVQAQRAAYRAAEQRAEAELAAEKGKYGEPTSRAVIAKHLATAIAACRANPSQDCEWSAQRSADRETDSFHYYHEPINDYDLQRGHVDAINHGYAADQYGRFHDWTKD
jgi:hypothetical protein